MKVRALRGVCIGVDRHLSAGDPADLEPASVQFLVSIGAVEVVVEAPPPVVVEEAQPALPPVLFEAPKDEKPTTKHTSKKEK